MSEDRLISAIDHKRAVELRPPARPPEGRAPNLSRTSARATRRVAYASPESL